MRKHSSNGAKALIKTLSDSGVDTCFTNPGTSEMHFVAALDGSDMRAVLCLFEGVATGAADGYARIANKPAATLLHLGCGLGNGLANLHNARKARVPMINIVGDHAIYHKQYDAPLESDIETVARNVSSWIRTCTSTEVAYKAPQQISTLILPADVSWGAGAIAKEADLSVATDIAAAALITQIADILLTCGQKTAILLGRRVLLEEGLIAAAKIAEKTGAKLFCEVFPTRLERGAGLPYVERIAYLAEMAAVQLRGYKHLVIIDSQEPVSFFAYPGKKSYLVPNKCIVHQLVKVEQDALGSLQSLVAAVGAQDYAPKLQTIDRPKLPSGKLNASKVCQTLGVLMPDNAIISDEAQTSGLNLPLFTAGAPKHDLLTLTGGAIGQSLPVAIGAAIAGKNSNGNKEKDRPVIALVGDGSAMYTIQSLWTMMNENLNVTVIVLNNRSYAILNIELERVNAKGAGPKAKSQLDLSKTKIDFVALAKGMGVPAEIATTAEEFNDALERAIREPGPHLIDAIVPSEYDGLKLKLLPYVLGAMSKIPAPIAKVLKKKLSP
jgi:acetolactate synthase-1/2/3 large subunit